ncbi:hypothetical protein HME9302_01031 [Alteripontixanthobacter maritimus]|uniref:Uncharacterized protein n=1 Tax=Alteripontixanthobacter maritimus TaxID=2161824 RepID=A0A369Q8G1_9SPHN|nr:AHH domain-containing protein [Alteripontixanthobacter maritimus]RDC59835.1 hypothetical protein HME9302_01031 [Alteripontixanthobacter maritimus]
MRGSDGYDPAMQRHHLVPLQVMRHIHFKDLFEKLQITRCKFDDFRLNGLLLPAQESAARRTGLPMHRGPHRHYNEMVMQRVGQIDSGFQRTRRRFPNIAGDSALMRLQLLARALRRRLSEQGRSPITLNSYDPIGAAQDFTNLDSLADNLWTASETAV